MTSRSRENDFVCSDEKFRLMEQALIRHRPWAEDIWERRSNLSLALAQSARPAKEKKFRFGIFCYLGWLFWRVRKAAVTMRHLDIPPADFLVYIAGDVSIEVDSLTPVARALADSGQSVVVLFNTKKDVPAEIIQQLHGIPIVSVSSDNLLGSLHGFLGNDARESLWLMTKAFVCLFRLRGSVGAFWNRGIYWLHDLLHLKAAERCWQQRIGKYHFQGIAVASEFEPSAAALCQLAKGRSWRIHHFQHGLPALHLTRGISSDIYCYSQADRDFFLRNGWSEDNVHALGHPRQRGLDQRIQKDRICQPEEGGLRLLFASQPPCPGKFERKEYEQTITAVMQAAVALNLTPDEFRVRLHPTESKEQFLAVTASCGLPCREQLFSRRTISEDLAWANVLITVFSTTAIEAAYADCLLTWLSFGPFRYEVREQLIARGYGRKAVSTQQLTEILSLCRDPARRSQWLAEQRQRAQELRILNPQAAVESAAVMVAAR